MQYITKIIDKYTTDIIIDNITISINTYSRNHIDINMKDGPSISLNHDGDKTVLVWNKKDTLPVIINYNGTVIERSK